MYRNRRRIRGARGQRLLPLRDERLERPFAHLYETGGMRRVHLRGHTNILKRLVIHTGGLLTLIRLCWQSLTPYKPVPARFSTREHHSTGRDAVVHVSVSKAGFTTGC